MDATLSSTDESSDTEAEHEQHNIEFSEDANGGQTAARNPGSIETAGEINGLEPHQTEDEIFVKDADTAFKEVLESASSGNGKKLKICNMKLKPSNP